MRSVTRDNTGNLIILVNPDNRFDGKSFGKLYNPNVNATTLEA